MAVATPLIFDIKRYSLEDGPGIRTTVFFKGCNLHCRWCHNPEAIDPRPEIGFYPRDCISCGDCVKTCPAGACSLENPVRIQRDRCDRCGECAAACPSRALRLLGRRYTAEALLSSILKDWKFYEVSGGGVTLSGGEPTLYLDYAAKILRKLQQLGLHTAVQTNGFFVWEEFRAKLLPHLDLVMMDVKVADACQHREYTGRDHAPVWANLEHLLAAKPTCLLPRIPLIPGFTATPDNLQALSSRLRALGVSRCVLLPYNATWFDKADAIGKPASPGLPTRLMTAAELAACREIFAWGL
jgi:pyruvate formate lyase activating enzyme